jgi:hypothetical protein
MYTPLVLPFPPDDKDLAAYKAYGAIISLGIIWGQHHLPLSPFFLLYLVHGFDAITDLSLIRTIAPDMGQRLSTWPPPHIMVAGQPELQLTLGHDPMNLIIEHVSHIQVFLSRCSHSHFLLNIDCLYNVHEADTHSAALCQCLRNSWMSTHCCTSIWDTRDQGQA